MICKLFVEQLSEQIGNWMLAEEIENQKVELWPSYIYCEMRDETLNSNWFIKMYDIESCPTLSDIKVASSRNLY